MESDGLPNVIPMAPTATLRQTDDNWSPNKAVVTAEYRHGELEYTMVAQVIGSVALQGVANVTTFKMRRRLPFWEATKADISETRTRLSCARRRCLTVSVIPRTLPSPNRHLAGLTHHYYTADERVRLTRASQPIFFSCRAVGDERVGLCALHSLFVKPRAYSRLIAAPSTHCWVRLSLLNHASSPQVSLWSAHKS